MNLNNNPLVSIIIPLYNKRPYVKRAIQSVQQQTLNNWELIIVDDGSTDGSVNEIPQNDPRIRLFQQENKGPGAARNAGLARAKGKYVAFLDADDEYLPTFLETGISFLEDKTVNATLVFTDFYYYPGKKRYKVDEEGKFSRVIDISEIIDLRLIKRLCSHWTCATIMKTDIVKKWGGFFDRYKCLYGEDGFLFIKLVFNEKIGIISEPLVIYHTEASSLYGGDTINKCFPIAPYLEYPDEIIKSCPPMEVDILKKMLTQIAFRKAISLAKCGEGKKAKDLFRRFVQYGCLSHKEILRGHLYISLAPILPTIRQLWRNMKSVISHRQRQ